MITMAGMRTLRRHRPELERFSVKTIALFGSYARNAQTDSSDLDVVVEFSAADLPQFRGPGAIPRAALRPTSRHPGRRLASQVVACPRSPRISSERSCMPKRGRQEYFRGHARSDHPHSELHLRNQYGQFPADSKTQDAVIRNIEILGGGAKAHEIDSRQQS